MGKGLKILFLIFAALSLVGCSKNTGLRAWVTTKNMVVYKDFRDDAQVPAFELKIGDVCVLGEQRTEKAYRYTEVLCPGRGYGWAADYAFAVITRENVNSVALKN
jgi:hypothetical protein